jgi:hypothetical protein
MTMQHAATSSTTTSEHVSELTVADLAGMSVAELESLYRDGTVPESLSVLDGAPRGRMLAVAGLDRGPALSALSRVAAAPGFPWAGKSFNAADDQHGEGINRVRLLGDRFRFTTRIDDSVVDGAPCILLDYDHDDNPWFIRRIRDELRQVAPDLFLGPALMRRGDDHRLVLYFAIDHS